MQTFTGKQYLKIDIANNFGLDKKTWNERIEWFDQNESNLMGLLHQADEPALFYAGIQAWQAAKRGDPSGYPVSFDATSSGLQLLACLTGDRAAAELCNVVPVIREPLDFSEQAEIERRDGYTVIYRAMVDALGEEGRITRDDTKEAIMTALYGSEAEPKRVFGEGILLQVFYATMERLAPGAWGINKAFLDMWDPEALVNRWVLPDNFHVEVKVMTRITEPVHFLNKPYDTFREENAPKESGRSLGANCTHSVDGMVVREMSRRCDYNANRIAEMRLEMAYLAQGGVIHTIIDDDEDAEMVDTLWKHYESSGYLSARILDHLHLHNMHMVELHVIQDLLDSLPAKPFKVISVHDCFRCLPNYVNDLRRQYNNQLMLIAKSKLLQFLVSQILGRNVVIGKLDEDLWRDIADTEYALS